MESSSTHLETRFRIKVPSIGLSAGTPNEELGKGLKEFATPQEEQKYQSTRPPKFPTTKPPTKEHA